MFNWNPWKPSWMTCIQMALNEFGTIWHIIWELLYKILGKVPNCDLMFFGNLKKNMARYKPEFDLWQRGINIKTLKKQQIE